MASLVLNLCTGHVGWSDSRSDRFTADKEWVVPTVSRLRWPPIVPGTSEEKNLNTPALWNTSNMKQYGLLKSYDLSSRSKFRP